MKRFDVIPPVLAASLTFRFGRRGERLTRGRSRRRRLMLSGVTGLTVIGGSVWWAAGSDSTVSGAGVVPNAAAKAGGPVWDAAGSGVPETWSEAGLKDFGGMVARLLAGPEAASAKDLIDAETLARRIVAGIPLLPVEAKEVHSTAQTLVRSRWTDVFGTVGNGPVKTAAVRSRTGFPSVVLRSVGSGGQPVFVELLLRPQGDSFRVVDSLSFVHGLYVSELLRTGILPPLAPRYPKAAAGLLKIDDAWLHEGSPVAAMLEAFDHGRHKDALAAATMIPENITKSRGIRAFVIASTMAIGNLDAPAALQRALWKQDPQDIGLAWLAYDSFLWAGDRAAARRVIDRLEGELGWDGMLDVCKAQICLERAHFEEASTLLDGVAAREPGLDLGIGLSLARVLGRQNFAAAIKILDDYYKRTGHRVTTDELDAPVFREFRRSAEFVAWRNGVRLEAKSASSDV